jgi:hypothetical protein
VQRLELTATRLPARHRQLSLPDSATFLALAFELTRHDLRYRFLRRILDRTDFDIGPLLDRPRAILGLVLQARDQLCQCHGGSCI